MSCNELKEGTFYLVSTPSVKGRFQYAGLVRGRFRKHLFQHFAIDLYLTEDEIMWYVEKDKTNANI
jgi:hypothetical protein